MDYEEKLLKQMNQLKSREDNNSGQHNSIKKHSKISI